VRSIVYSSKENYLSYEASTHAKRLKGGMTKNNQSLVLSMDDHKEGLLFDKLLKLQNKHGCDSNTDNVGLCSKNIP
jgi:hypothetical protein